MTCPCGSSNPYLHCCGRYHRGENVPDPVTLVKARFSAFALGKADFLIDTTHPSHPEASRPRPTRRKELLQVSESTRFIKLEILSSSWEDSQGTVTFRVHLQSKGQSQTNFTETSYFEKKEGKWLYHSGHHDEVPPT